MKLSLAFICPLQISLAFGSKTVFCKIGNAVSGKVGILFPLESERSGTGQEVGVEENRSHRSRWTCIAWSSSSRWICIAWSDTGMTFLKGWTEKWNGVRCHHVICVERSDRGCFG
ncbi:hypothetical protein AVEN_267219-1 [Araneus ventricosus]|uniref:Secreted protein n=1 Tax=Araneus ventricosus TaxID=182803 RepID=A0A4Y2L338_ARAVE|nr:hypothetical protein AVEN_267219-1 [Araneus ventricosus]